MELDEFHIFNHTFGTIYHGDTVAGCYQRIGCVSIDSFATTCSHNGYFRQEGVHFSGFFVQDIRTEAFDARCMTVDDDSHMVLRDDFYGKEVFEYSDIRMVVDGFD